jgi:hypothetical protein
MAISRHHLTARAKATMTRFLGRGWSFRLPAVLVALLIAAGPPRAVLFSTPGAQAPPASAKIWEGRYEEIEAFIRTADIERIEDVPIGVTRPKRAYLKPGGPVASVSWKVLAPGRYNGYWESYRSEIAAYELDKLLHLDMVPVAVEKRWHHEVGAAILWLKPVHPWKDIEAQPKPAHWDRQVIRMKMFDNLICNKDRNAGNLLVDDAWNLFLIDHSRAFITDQVLPQKLTRIDRDLWDRMLALDEPSLSAAIGKWLSRGDLRAVIKRRDKMKAVVDKLVKTSGEAAVFVRQH